MSKKLEGREIASFKSNTRSNEEVEEELEKIRRTLGINVKNKKTPQSSKMMPTPSAASSS